MIEVPYITKKSAYEIAKQIKNKKITTKLFVVKHDFNSLIELWDEQTLSNYQEDNPIVLYTFIPNENKSIQKIADEIYLTSVQHHVDKVTYHNILNKKHHWTIILQVPESINSKNGAVAYFGGFAPYAKIIEIKKTNNNYYVLATFISSLDNYVHMLQEALWNWGVEKFVKTFNLKLLDEDPKGLNNQNLVFYLQETLMGLMAAS